MIFIGALLVFIQIYEINQELYLKSFKAFERMALNLFYRFVNLFIRHNKITINWCQYFHKATILILLVQDFLHALINTVVDLQKALLHISFFLPIFNLIFYIQSIPQNSLSLIEKHLLQWNWHKSL